MEVDFKLNNFNLSFGISSKSATTTLEVNPEAEQVVPCDEKETSWRVCNTLKTAIRNSKSEGRPVRFTFVLEGLKCKLKVHGPFIDYLVTTMGPGIQMKILIENLTCSLIRTKSPVNDVIKIPGGLSVWRSGGRNVRPIFLTFFRPSSATTTLPNFDLLACSADLSIRFIGSVALPQVEVDSESGVNFNKWILSEQFQTDMEIIAENGTKIPCHKIFLTGKIAVFEKMLQHQAIVEGQPPSINLKEMSEVGVRSLLSYIYYEDVEPARQDFNVCLELLEASEKYGIEKLQQKIKGIIKDKPVEWFNLDNTLRLFCFTRNLESCLEIKQLSANVLKVKYAELQDSETFKQFFKENSETALDLCCSIAAVGGSGSE